MRHTVGKKYRSVLAMVWDTSSSLWFKIKFTFIIFSKRIEKYEPIIVLLLTIIFSILISRELLSD